MGKIAANYIFKASAIVIATLFLATSLVMMAGMDDTAKWAGPEKGVFGTRAPTTVLFSDDFERTEGTDLGSDWIESGSAWIGISDAFHNSTSRSMYIRADAGYASVAKAFDTEDATGLCVSYWIKRGMDAPGSGSPEDDENIEFQYLNDMDQWITLEVYEGGGTPGGENESFHPMPADAYHDNFQIRFHFTQASNWNDYWHLDDINITFDTPTYGVWCSPLTDTVAGEPSEILDSEINVKNFGLTNDVYDLTVDSDWPVVLRDSGDTTDITSISVDSLMNDTFIIRITIPAAALDGEKAYANVTVQSQNAPLVTKEVSIFAVNTAGVITVGVYRCLNTGSISYYQWTGQFSNSHTAYFNVLDSDPEARFGTQIITDLSPSTLEDIDVLVLADNSIPDPDLVAVDSWFGDGKGIICIEDAAVYACYSGFLIPETAGDDGTPGYWEHDSLLDNQKVVLSHDITEDYILGNTYASKADSVVYTYGNLPDDAIVLTEEALDDEDVYAVARIVPERGRIVALGPYGHTTTGLEDLVRDAVEWSSKSLRLNVTIEDISKTSCNQSDQDVPLFRLTLEATSGPVNLNSITVNYEGSGDQQDVDEAWIFQDLDGSMNRTVGDVIYAHQKFSYNKAKLTKLLLLEHNTPVTFLVTYDIADDATIGATVGATLFPADVDTEFPVNRNTIESVSTGNATINARQDLLDVKLTSMAPSTVEQGQRNLAMAYLTVEPLAFAVSLKNVSLDVIGTGVATDIERPILYMDQDNDKMFDINEDQKIVEGTIDSSTLHFSGISKVINENSPVVYFVVVDINATGSLNKTVGLEISPDGFVVAGPDGVSDFAVQATSLTEIIDTIPPDVPGSLHADEITHESVNIVWDKSYSVDLEGYNIYRCTEDTYGDWEGPLNGDTLIVGESYLDTGLYQGVYYIYAVTAVDEVPNESELSNATHGETSVVFKPKVNLTAPGAGKIILNNTPELSWEIDYYVPSFVRYMIYLDDVNPPTYIYEFKYNGTSWVVNEELEEGTYYWKVVPSDGDVLGTCESGIWTFTVVIDPDIPEVILDKPTHLSTSMIQKPVFTWKNNNTPHETVVYDLYLDTVDPPVKIEAAGLKELTYTPEDDLEEGTYYWKVIPRIGDLEGKCLSGVRQLTIDTDFIQVHNVEISFDVESININKTAPGIVYLTVKNTGNNEDTFTLTTSGSVELTELNNLKLTIPTGEEITQRVVIKHESRADGKYTATVEVTAGDGKTTSETSLSIIIGNKVIVTDDDDDDDDDDDSESNVLTYVLAGVFGLIVLVVIIIIIVMLVLKAKKPVEISVGPLELFGKPVEGNAKLIVEGNEYQGGIDAQGVVRIPDVSPKDLTKVAQVITQIGDDEYTFGVTIVKDKLIPPPQTWTANKKSLVPETPASQTPAPQPVPQPAPQAPTITSADLPADLPEMDASEPVEETTEEAAPELEDATEPEEELPELEEDLPELEADDEEELELVSFDED